MSFLNSEQQKAVRTTEGRVLILAGAGSGKTSVLTHRIAHLINEKGALPSQILGLTFTNKAAGEMRERVAKMIGSKKAKEVSLCTFHSFCMQVLRKEIHHLGYTNKFSLYDEKDIRRLAKTLARNMLQQEGELPSVEPLVNEISSLKNQGLSHETIKEPFTRQLAERMHTALRSYNAVDFDSLLTLTLELFKKHPEILATYQERFLYIMIDEYQDTNPIQYALAKCLSGKHNNLCVVGDDDQSIYGWRGAEVRHILEFPSDTTIKLEQNYRSTPTILDAANRVIANNSERHDKQLWSSQDRGEPISLFHAPTEVDEAQAVVARLLHMRESYKLKWKDIAILYRSNVLARPIEVALMQAGWKDGDQWRRGIPYQVFGGTQFFERSEIKDALAYLRVISNPRDQEALLRIINVPRRGISDRTLNLLTTFNRKNDLPLWNLLENIPPEININERARSAVENFVSLMKEAKEQFSSRKSHEAFEWLMEHINYKKAIEEDVKSEKMREFKWENIEQCKATLEEHGGSLDDFLTETLLDRDNVPDRKSKKGVDAVNLMTFHSAKGLEFNTCFLIGLEDHLLPHAKSIEETGIEEERRLFYVALTRAKKHLILSMARKRKRHGKEELASPSRFLFEIPKELLKVSSWKSLS